MPSVPNQRKIIIEKAQSNKNNLYAIVNLKALNNAMLSLNGEAFKMWMYFNKNQDKYSFDLSRKNALESGIGSESSYRRAFSELVNKGYLQEVSKGVYKFKEYIDIPEAEEKEEHESVCSF